MIDPRNPDFSNTPVNPRRPNFNYKPADPTAPPVVSIITPFYNTGTIFQETAQSVMKQSLQQWEWIIVNDGSTDLESLQILETYRNLDPRVKIIDHPKNLGLPAARNTGAREAQSNYLLYIDSDDLLEPTAAEKWFWFLESYPRYSFAGGYSTGFGVREYLWQAGFQNMEANLDENRINHVVMIRKDVWHEVGGYDETMRQGLEDWDFWVRCANLGYWGNSIPEYLHWYRTRLDHTDRWGGLHEEILKQQREIFRRCYPNLWQGGFPKFLPEGDIELMHLRLDKSCENKLQKNKPRLVMIFPWFVTGGADKFNLDLITQLNTYGWEITLVSTLPSINPWLHEFEKLTPDVFPMINFLKWNDYPRFLCYLIESRQADAMLISASQEAYRLLPFIRFRFPNLPIMDYIHFVTPEWLDGGFPRLSLLFHSSLDLSAVTSHQVKNWLVTEGADEDRVQVCTANVDTDFWQPDIDKRKQIRDQLEIRDHQLLILFIGRIEQQKQPRVFAKTMLNLTRQNLPFISLIVGDGSLKDWLEDFIKNYSLQNNVRVIGEVSPERVRDLMTAGDIVFLPSENEGISLTFYEGMSCGLVPVGADVGGQRELVTQDCGVLLPRGKEDEEAERYATVLADLIKNPQKRTLMKDASRDRVNQYFRLDQMGARMHSLIIQAQQLRVNSPRSPSTIELGNLLARQTTEYFRSLGEVRRLGSMLPTRIYVYSILRRLLYPYLKPYLNRRWCIILKQKVRAILKL